MTAIAAPPPPDLPLGEIYEYSNQITMSYGQTVYQHIPRGPYHSYAAAELLVQNGQIDNDLDLEAAYGQIGLGALSAHSFVNCVITETGYFNYNDYVDYYNRSSIHLNYDNLYQRLRLYPEDFGTPSLTLVYFTVDLDVIW